MADTSPKSETAQREEDVLAFWKREKIFEKSLNKSAPKGEFVFYDGPPFATGLPHAGNLLSSVDKDLTGRYKTMRGYRVRRRWGWDTHGLPIETKVEEKLGLKSKKDILNVGIETFNATARGMVLEYVEGWKKYVDRVGRWVDFDHSYKTMDSTYIESVWWALSELHKKGRLYEGKKVLMYCPHCETPLAKAEIAMDNTYKDVTEEAVTVKFKVKNPAEHGLPQNTYFLAWTTTPWTLPGNVALAVGAGITYVLVERNEERIILARDRFDGVGDVLKEYPGESLIGIEYEPLYAIPKVLQHKGKKHAILPASFVAVDEGTGIVHTAVMYGEDDYALGQKEDLPMVQLLEQNGTFNKDAPEALVGLYYKKAESVIKEDLAARGLVFIKEQHTHSYPHCYRCGTALIYNAVPSWFIDIQSVKEKLLSENEKINWHPRHLKHGRFKNIVEGAPDWGISRSRFWASPLPFWKDKNGNTTVIGSLDELKQLAKKSGNTYFLMRHGESEKNIKDIMSSDENAYPLTEKGRADVQKSAESVTGVKFDLIITSPLLRTRETAEIMRKALGLNEDQVVIEARIREIDVGAFEGKSMVDYDRAYPEDVDFFDSAPGGGETKNQIRARVGEFLYELEKKYQNKTILIVSHGSPTWLMQAVAKGCSLQNRKDFEALPYFQQGEVRPFEFVPIPHNRSYELDFHRPYIDELEVVNEKGEPLSRIPEVVDCWLESSAMPFAEYHYPFENQKEFEKRSPGDFIAEYIAQTRTWFYYTHALGILLFNRQAFKNVVSTGTILAADGSKMSKSKANFTDPYALFERYGADAFRFYLLSSVVMQAEDFNFKDEELRETHNKVVNILRNTLTFYTLYKDQAPPILAKSTHLLDRWILARLGFLIQEVTAAMDDYDTVRASRPIREFIEDFSTWYIRRSRERVKGSEAAHALSSMRYVLKEFSKIVAPLMPFIAEEIFLSVRMDDDPESVHLSAWPKPKKNFFNFFLKEDHTTLFEEMEETRSLVSLALKLRQEANIKVRQPLSKLIVKSTRLKNKGECIDLIKDEVNVKEVVFDDSILEAMRLDTAITPELKEEGEVRELMRTIQDLRKSAALLPKDRAVLTFAGDTALLEKHWADISRVANLDRFERGSVTYVKKL